MGEAVRRGFNLGWWLSRKKSQIHFLESASSGAGCQLAQTAALSQTFHHAFLEWGPLTEKPQGRPLAPILPSSLV